MQIFRDSKAAERVLLSAMLGLASRAVKTPVDLSPRAPRRNDIKIADVMEAFFVRIDFGR